MNSRTIAKVVFVSILMAYSFWVLYPNVVWYSMPLQKRQEEAKRKNETAKKVIPLGLDLQGGVHLVYQLDTTKLPDSSDQTITRAVEQNITVINRRIDALGVANSIVARQGKDLILIQMPGVYESETAKQLIGKTALLEFRIVKDSEALLKIMEAIDKAGLQPEDISSKPLPADIQKLVPAGLQLMPSRDGGYLLVNDKPDLTGNYLKEARVEFANSGYQMGGMHIGFELDPKGAQLFAALTAAHINERLAIILDNVIQSAPNIQTQISGGRGQITGSFSPQDAKNLANILNSGNLQAPMRVVEERTVGPELGEDSIRAGMKSIIIGFILVVSFMLIFYRFSGFLSDIALVMNLILLLMIMSQIGATLTMPGIAGTILSLAMAVDANVLILERVREELAKGKTPHSAIDEGYSKAFAAIFDGHVTSLISAVFLFQFGSGPVKGFAVTLFWGLIISLFTAVFVTKMFYEVWFEVAKPKTISV